MTSAPFCQFLWRYQQLPIRLGGVNHTVACAENMDETLPIVADFDRIRPVKLTCFNPFMKIPDKRPIGLHKLSFFAFTASCSACAMRHAACARHGFLLTGSNRVNLPLEVSAV